MNQKLLNDLALQTGGSFYPAVFETYQKAYTLNVLSEIYQVFQKQQFDGYAIDFWDDVVQHFQLDNTEEEMLLKSNKNTG
jgi:hypothetical protein